MRGLDFIKTKNHAERSIYDGSVRSIDHAFEDLYENISDHWQQKAKRLQSRRWRKIRHQTA